jgi:hypothetical protein
MLSLFLGQSRSELSIAWAEDISPLFANIYMNWHVIAARRGPLRE